MVALMSEPFSVQLRSEETGIQHVPTLSEALRIAQADPSIWKVSFSLPTGERVRLVRDYSEPESVLLFLEPIVLPHDQG